MSRFVIAFFLKSKHLLISWLQSLSTVISEPKKINLSLLPLFLLLSAMKWWDRLPWSQFFKCWVSSRLSSSDGYLGLLWTMLWTWAYKCQMSLWDHLVILLGICSEVELLNHTATFKTTVILFSKVTVVFYNPSNSVQGLQFLQIIANTCYFLFFFFWNIVAILIDMKWYLIVIFHLHLPKH